MPSTPRPYDWPEFPEPDPRSLTPWQSAIMHRIAMLDERTEAMLRLLARIETILTEGRIKG